jgi:uncharacterized small protein (DUF1192 family)
MAYYNGFPATYQNYQYQMPGQQVNTGIIWVQGEAGAKSYLVAPNTTVQLWDSETQRIFLKSADASGMPSMKILEYTIQGDSAPSAAVSAPAGNEIPYATKDAVKELQNEIDTLRAEIERLTTTRRRRKEEPDNE